jgi:hypothetical protein
MASAVTASFRGAFRPGFVHESERFLDAVVGCVGVREVHVHAIPREVRHEQAQEPPGFPFDLTIERTWMGGRAKRE